MREDRDGNLVLSISRALAEKDWERAEELMRTQDIFECPVDSFNRGGVIVKLGQVRGFVPATQLSSIIPLHERRRLRRALCSAAGRLAAPEGHRHRPQAQPPDPLRTSGHARVAPPAEGAVARLAQGRRHVSKAIISSIADFGAFVDLGGADGLIHLSELSWNRVSHPERSRQGRREGQGAGLERRHRTPSHRPELAPPDAAAVGSDRHDLRGRARWCAAASPSW